jgi:UDP-N-acetyl-D-glucosamine dehydrogenase
MNQNNADQLRVLIDTRKARVGVMGMGYVGLPLVELFAKCGFGVLGFDVDKSKVKMIEEGRSYIGDVDEKNIQLLRREGQIEATTDHMRLKECDVILICVPTPFTITKDPDISFIVSASEEIRYSLRQGQMIILKSTTFPETTEKVVLPILEKSGLRVGTDFFLSFSPERIDPGNAKYTVSNTPTVVGGVTDACTSLTVLLLEKCDVTPVAVSSPRVAEMSKLLENIFRSVNIALVNELARLCDRMENIDIWEVIYAASTKPFGFMPFYPGPGIGGHCILVDPYYLSWKAREHDFHTNFIELAAETNEEMPYYVAEKVFEALRLVGVSACKANVIILGMAFKKDVADTRNSPAMKVMSLLSREVAMVRYNDPYVERIEVNGQTVKSIALSPQALSDADCVLIATDHSSYDYAWIVKNAKIVVDTRNATRGLGGGRVLKLGGGPFQRG